MLSELVTEDNGVLNVSHSPCNVEAFEVAVLADMVVILIVVTLMHHPPFGLHLTDGPSDGHADEVHQIVFHLAGEAIVVNAHAI